MRKKGFFIVGLGCLGLAGPLYGQDSTLQRLERQLRQAEMAYELTVNPALSISERAVIDYGGQVNFSFLAVDDVNQSTRILRQTDVQLFGRLNFDDVHQFFGRLRFTYRDYNSGDSFDGDGDEFVQPISDRWWYRFNLAAAARAYGGQRLDGNLTLQVGRQFVTVGSGLALAEELYAAKLAVEFGDFSLMGLIGTTPKSTVIDFDSSRPSFDEDTSRNFFGGMIAYSGIKDHTPYFYILDQRDKNSEDEATFTLPGPGGVGTIAVPTEFDYNSTYFAVGINGLLSPKLIYSTEFIYEIGDTLSNPFVPGAPAGVPQTRDDVSAWAARAGLTYLFRDANRSRIEFETILASGDDDRLLDTSNTLGGNRSGTKDRSFNGFGFAKTGLAFGAPVSNLLLFRAGATTYPAPDQGIFKNLQIGLDVLVFNKLDTDAPIDEGTSDDRYLGLETDVFINWRIASDLMLNLSYGVFFPGDAINVENDARHFLYTGITYSF